MYYEYVFSSSFTVRQYADCLSALSGVNFPTPISVPYNAAGGMVAISTSWSDFYSNQYSTDCPITSCELLTADCSAALSSADVVLGADPFGISATETNAAGYTVDFCFKCTMTNPVGSYWNTRFTFTVNGDPGAPAIDCSTALTSTGYMDPPAFPYNSAGSTVTIAADYTDFFTHSN